MRKVYNEASAGRALTFTSVVKDSVLFQVLGPDRRPFSHSFAPTCSIAPVYSGA
jgi:hypothetical protein